MNVRRAEQRDASSIAAISIEVWVGTYLRRGVSPRFADYALETFTTEKVETFLSDPMQVTLVSEDDEGLVGYIRVVSGRTAPVEGCLDVELATLYVQPRHHGKGHGARLLEAAFQFCRTKSIASVWLAANAENGPALSYYLSKGFKQVGETYFQLGDEKYLNHVFAFDLT